MLKRSEARELAVKTIYSKFFNSDCNMEAEEPLNSDFSNEILQAYESNQNEILDLISSHLKGYTINRLYKIDLAILVLVVIEIIYIKQNPIEVVVNEAVELAKKFSTEKSPKFINGVLAEILKNTKA